MTAWISKQAALFAIDGGAPIEVVGKRRIGSGHQIAVQATTQLLAWYESASTQYVDRRPILRATEAIHEAVTGEILR
jgi:hypothetical protein